MMQQGTTEMEWIEKVMPDLIGYWPYLSDNAAMLSKYKQWAKKYSCKDVLASLGKIAEKYKHDNLPKFIEVLKDCGTRCSNTTLNCSDHEYNLIVYWRSIYADGRSVRDILDIIRNGGQAILDELDEKRCQKARAHCERFGLYGYPHAWVLSANGKENIDVLTGERYPLPDLSGMPLRDRVKAYERYVAPYRPKKANGKEKTVFDNVLKSPVDEEIPW
jgi:hypothetical protein